MTAPSTALHAIGAPFVRFGAHPVTLWSAFAVVHLWLGFVNLYGPNLPLGDVTLVYRFWVEQGLIAGNWVGIDTSWVYPIVALLPMLAAYVLGPEPYAVTWLTLVTVLDALALLAIVGGGRRARHTGAAWWWMLYLAALGPIALGRIDSITAPLAIVAIARLAENPRSAAALLAIGAWIKVWPAALLVALVLALRERSRVVLATLAVSIVVVAGGLAIGAGASLLSPITEQSGRGLQVEAPISTVWLWAAAAGEWSAHVYYDHSILTWQVFGEGTQQAAVLATPALALVVLLVVLLGVLAVRRGVDDVRLVPVLAFALVMALVLVNKVGSPQFATWIAAPVVLGLLWRPRGGVSFHVPVVVAVLIAALTQVVYPFRYGELLGLQAPMLAVLSLRNALYAVLLGWAIVVIVQLIRHARGPDRGTLEAGGEGRRTRDREPLP